MKIENVKEFTRRTKASKSTIYRFYKRNPELWNDTKLRNNKRVFPIEHAKYFDSEIMFDENKLLKQENQSMRNLIDGLMDKESLSATLWHMEWSLYVTVAYKLDRSNTNCYKLMHSLYEDILIKFGENSEIRMFFATESFKNRDGHHNHFVLYVSDKRLLEQLEEDIVNFFVMDRVDIKLYDKYKAALFYTAKEGLHSEDWDILGNKLSKGIREDF